MNYRNLISVLMMSVGLVFGQAVTGFVGNGEEPLVGANIVIEGTELGGVTDAEGKFVIETGTGTFDLTASYIGYVSQTKSVRVGDIVGSVSFDLETDVVALTALEVLASRADETTPVAYTNVSKEEMEIRLGSQDIPMILNTTPSVYATQQGGGAGDARINIRGFNQRNVAVMINGVPQNDMENGWVYWSNWDGVGDATSSIQVQRGLSAVNLATPSIGGTMNIITDPAQLEKGGKFKQEAGDGGFLKTTVNYNTGLIGDKLALSGTIVRKTGDGIIDGTWTDAWSYYLGGSYAVSEDQRFELYAIGAPQRHGQNLYKQNIATYSQELAGSIDGYDDSAYVEGNKFETEAGRFYNQNWAPVSPDYDGKQYWYMYGARTTDRFNKGFLNERENFFHKPLVNLNHFLNINEKTKLSSVLYWSGGSGGGTGTYGSVSRTPAVEGERWYASSPWMWDWNAEIEQNRTNFDADYSETEARSTGILRNSINRQNTYGLISKLNYLVSDELEVQVGLDWRTAGIEHAREVRDLLGGDYYVDFADDNAPDGKVVKLGDIIAYHNETTVDWIGGFLQGNYTTDKLNLYGMGGLSSITYTYEDHFAVNVDEDGNAIDNLVKADAITTYQLKGGGLYNVNDNLGVFLNAGLVEKAPILDNVIYYDGTVATDPANEKFIASEFGVNYGTEKFGVKVSAYNTDWKDRNLTKSVSTGQGSSGDTDIIFLKGVNQKHQGIEIETKVKPNDLVELDLIASFGNWKFDGDADGTYQENQYNEEGQVVGFQTTEYAYALDGLYVGDMPQTAYILGVTLKPLKGLRLQALYKTYDKNYSDWSPSAREIEDGVADRAQVWEAPGYSKLDLHASYKLPIKGYDISLTGHVFNALDEVFVQDAVDNSRYNGFGSKEHLPHNAEVFLGTPRYANIGVSINF